MYSCIMHAVLATHGTGHGLTNMAALVTKLKFVSGSGEVSNRFYFATLHVGPIGVPVQFQSIHSRLHSIIIIFITTHATKHLP